MRINKLLAFVFAFLSFSCISGPLQAQDTVRVMTYNLLRYGAQGINCTPTGVSARNTWFTNIMEEAMPDIFGVNEVGPSDGPTSPQNNILINILQPLNPAYEAATITFNGSQDIANQLYYNSDKLGIAQQASITQNFRVIDYYKLYYKGPGLAAGDTTYIEVVLAHFAASNQTQALNQAEAIMQYLNNLGRPGNIIVMGDFNQNSSNTGPMQEMLAYANLDVRMRDPINLSGTWSNNSSADHAWSQSTRSSGSSDCGSGGGLDDRFDLIMTSNSILNNTDNIGYIPGSYWVFGNTNSPNPSVPSTVANSLIPMSDHYPVIVDLEVSKAVSVDPALASAVAVDILGMPEKDKIVVRMDVPGGYEGAYTFRVMDLNGKEVSATAYDLRAGTQRVEMPATTLSEGFYVLKVEREGEVVAVEKMVLR